MPTEPLIFQPCMWSYLGKTPLQATMQLHTQLETQTHKLEFHKHFKFIGARLSFYGRLWLLFHLCHPGSCFSLHPPPPRSCHPSYSWHSFLPCHLSFKALAPLSCCHVDLQANRHQQAEIKGKAGDVICCQPGSTYPTNTSLSFPQSCPMLVYISANVRSQNSSKQLTHLICKTCFPKALQ